MLVRLPQLLVQAEALVPRSLSAWRATHASDLGRPCANCACAIEGPYCLACGQGAESFERSIGSLFVEAFESLLHADATRAMAARATAVL